MPSVTTKASLTDTLKNVKNKVEPSTAFAFMLKKSLQIRAKKFHYWS